MKWETVPVEMKSEAAHSPDGNFVLMLVFNTGLWSGTLTRNDARMTITVIEQRTKEEAVTKLEETARKLGWEV